MHEDGWEFETMAGYTNKWTNKQIGAVAGFLLVVSIALLGAGTTALAVLVGLGGFFIGKYLDGELDLEEIRARAQERFRRGEPQARPDAVHTATPRDGAAAPVVEEPVGARRPDTGRVH